LVRNNELVPMRRTLREFEEWVTTSTKNCKKKKRETVCVWEG
jgi:hypothetical protein